MNKLGNALYEIHHMDMLAAKDQWVNKIHPLVKLMDFSLLSPLEFFVDPKNVDGRNN